VATNKDLKIKNGIQLAGQITSTLATGTAPLVVASTTLVTNLNADLLDGMNTATANTASTIVYRDASGNFSAGTITATLNGNATNITGTYAGTLTSSQVTTALGYTPGSGTGTVSSVSVTTANGVSGTVATSTTTPAITLSFTTQTFGDATTNVATTAFVDQLRDVPANAQASTYTLVLSDRGKCIDANGNITIPANTSAAFPVGAVVGFTNVSAAAITIAITTDTLHLAGTATTGTRTLASWGMASMRKVSATVWVISGAGLT
jgi:hypothetical protein